MTRFYFMIFALMIFLFFSQLQASYQTPFLMEEEGLYLNDSVALTQNIPQKGTKRKLMEEKVFTPSLPVHKTHNGVNILDSSYPKIDGRSQSKNKIRKLSSEQGKNPRQLLKDVDTPILPASQERVNFINNMQPLCQGLNEPKRQDKSFQDTPPHESEVVRQGANMNNPERRSSLLDIVLLSQLTQFDGTAADIFSPYKTTPRCISPQNLQPHINRNDIPDCEACRGAYTCGLDISSSKSIILSSPPQQEFLPLFQLRQETFSKSIALDADKEIVDIDRGLFDLKIAEIDLIYREPNMCMSQQESNIIPLNKSNNSCNKSPQNSKDDTKCIDREFNLDALNKYQLHRFNLINETYLSKVYKHLGKRITFASFLKICREVAYGTMLNLKTQMISERYKQSSLQIYHYLRILHTARIITDQEAYLSLDPL
jgi:hypothetical protein